MLEEDHYPRRGSWHSLVKGMRKAATEIDRILIDNGEIFIFMRHDDDHRMWCHHWTIDHDLRKLFDEGKVGINDEVEIRLEGKWPL